MPVVRRPGGRNNPYTNLFFYRLLSDSPRPEAPDDCKAKAAAVVVLEAHKSKTFTDAARSLTEICEED